MVANNNEVEGLLLRTARTAHRADDLRDADIVRSAQARLLDSLGMMLADRHNPRSLAAQGWSGFAGSTPAGLAFRMSLLTFGSGLDDFDESTRSHPGSVIVPAILAAAMGAPSAIGRSVSGTDLLAALTVGYQAMTGLGRLMGAPRIHSLGYLPSAILGAPAAALAVGRVWHLKEEALAACMGIGASVASGINEFDDADRLRAFQGAWASRSAVDSATLARLGLTPSAYALEAPGGLIRHLAPDADLMGVDLMAGPPAVEQVSYKPFPHFSDLHPATSAVIELIRERDLDPGDIESVMVRLPPKIASGLHHSYPPESQREARRSPEFSLATVLVRRCMTPAEAANSLAHAEVTDSDTVEMGRRVTVRFDLSDSETREAVVTVSLRDDSKFTAEAAGYPGDGRKRDLRWGWSEVSERFVATVAPPYGQDTAQSIVEWVDDLIRADDVSATLSKIIGLLS